MTNLHHLYITAHGSYSTGSWLGETAQIGLRVAFAPSVSAPLAGEIFTPTVGGEISADSGVQTGTHGSLAKTWTARIGDVGSLENADAGLQIDAAEDVWTFLNGIKTFQYSAFRWTHVKVASVNEVGATPRPASVYTFTAPLVGAGATALPPQIALAVSTRANLVGRRGRGRVYIPALYSGILGADGTVSAGNANTIRAAFKTLIDDLQALPGLTEFMPIVTVMSADSDTAVRPVEVRTGSRLDTIQSRRRQVSEVYTTTAL